MLNYRNKLNRERMLAFIASRAAQRWSAIETLNCEEAFWGPSLREIRRQMENRDAFEESV